MTRRRFLSIGTRIKNPSTARTRPAPREVQTEYLSVLRPARAGFVSYERGGSVNTSVHVDGNGGSGVLRLT